MFTQSNGPSRPEAENEGELPWPGSVPVAEPGAQVGAGRGI